MFGYLGNKRKSNHATVYLSTKMDATAALVVVVIIAVGAKGQILVSLILLLPDSLPTVPADHRVLLRAVGTDHLPAHLVLLRQRNVPAAEPASYNRFHIHNLQNRDIPREALPPQGFLIMIYG